MDPNLEALTNARVRRLNRDAAQRAADLSDARNRVLDVGPDRDAVTMATVLREGGPGRPRLTAALVALAADTYRKLHGTSAPATTRSTPTGRNIDQVTPVPQLPMPISPGPSLTRTDLRAGRSCRVHLVRNCAACRQV